LSKNASGSGGIFFSPYHNSEILKLRYSSLEGEKDAGSSDKEMMGVVKSKCENNHFMF